MCPVANEDLSATSFKPRSTPFHTRLRPGQARDRQTDRQTDRWRLINGSCPQPHTMGIITHSLYTQELWVIRCIFIKCGLTSAPATMRKYVHSNISICWWTSSWSICARYSRPGGIPGIASGAAMNCGAGLCPGWPVIIIIIFIIIFNNNSKMSQLGL